MKAVLILIFVVAGTAWSQQCFYDLAKDYPTAALQRKATNEDALILVVKAVQLLEPVLPALQSDSIDLSAYSNSQYNSELRFLAERQLLPASMKLGAFQHENWLDMLWRIASWYDLDVFSSLPEQPSLFALIRDISALLDRIRNLRNPIAIINTDAEQESRVVFLALIHLDSIYPRLIVDRPGNLPFDDRQAYLQAISTCTLHVQHYFTTPGAVASQLFTSTNESRVIIAQSEPDLYPANTFVPEGEELAALTFTSEQTQDLQRYAAIFLGSNLPPQLLPRILLQVKTNMSLAEIRALFQP